MTKQEFEKISGKTVSQGDYANIEFVYQFHPSIPNVGGKEMIAELYNLGGMRLIKDMLPTARTNKDLEERLHHMNLEAARIKEIMRQLAAGTMSEEEEKSI
ncbi:MAG: hypothetical protein IKF75_05125 [Lachnospiraceae bacterium]|nr:hypothetical protein [Lachnospiraceae bacterium]